MCQKESWGAIFATTEAHSTQRDQPPRMHGPGLWMYEQKEQRVTPVPIIGVNCNLWCPGWDGKDLGGKPEQDPCRIHLQTMAPIRNMIRCWRGSRGVHQACRQIRVLVQCSHEKTIYVSVET